MSTKIYDAYVFDKNYSIAEVNYSVTCIRVVHK